MQKIMLRGTAHNGTYFVTEVKYQGTVSRYGYIVLPDKLPNYLVQDIKKIPVEGGWILDKYVIEQDRELITVTKKDKKALHVICFNPDGNSIDLFSNIAFNSHDWQVSDIASECVRVLKEINIIFNKLQKRIDYKMKA